MSDQYAVRRYHRQNAPGPEPGGRMKLGKFIPVLVLACLVLAAILLSESGLLEGDCAQFSGPVLERINLERQANSLEPVEADPALSSRALTAGRNVRHASLVFSPVTSPLAGDTPDIFVIPRLSWMAAGSDGRQQILDALENSDPGFRGNVLGAQHRRIGVGVSADLYNYYLAVTWE